MKTCNFGRRKYHISGGNILAPSIKEGLEGNMTTAILYCQPDNRFHLVDSSRADARVDYNVRQACILKLPNALEETIETTRLPAKAVMRLSVGTIQAHVYLRNDAGQIQRGRQQAQSGMSQPFVVSLTFSFDNVVLTGEFRKGQYRASVRRHSESGFGHPISPNNQLSLLFRSASARLDEGNPLAL